MNGEICCENCRFFFAEHRILDTNIGSCRKNPPVIVDALSMSWADDSYSDLLRMTRFPIVTPDDWCGEFKAIE